MANEVLKVMGGQTLPPVPLMDSKNYQIVADEMANRGMEGEPYTHVKTFQGWLKENRAVKKGEKMLCKVGVVKAVTVKEEGREDKHLSYLKPCFLFHISQTEPITPRKKQSD